MDFCLTIPDFICNNSLYEKMMIRIKTIAALIIAALWGSILFAQDLSYSRPGRSYYREMDNPRETNPDEWAKVRQDINVSFASDNIRYPKEQVPKVSNQAEWQATAWRGEKVHTQILVWTKKEIPSLSFQVRDLVDETGNKIPESTIKAAFVRYVMTDGSMLPQLQGYMMWSSGVMSISN